MGTAPYLDISIKKVKNLSALIGEGAFELGTSLVAMIMVERFLGEAGLGVFAYLLSIAMFAGFISEFGIARYLETEIGAARKTDIPVKIIETSLRAVIFTSFVCVLLFLVTAAFDTAHTRVEEKMVAYLIIAVTIPVRNINRIRIAILHGRGAFGIAASLKTWKRVYLLGMLFFLLTWHVPASYLMLAYLVSELGLMIKARNTLQLPGFRTLWKSQNLTRAILRKSRFFLLTDEALDLVLYMDFFVLGVFVSAADLGLYAEASIIARLFLLIPLSIKPAFRKQYCLQAAQNRSDCSAISIQISTSLLFFIHSVMALCFLLYFPELRSWLYHFPGKSMFPFYVFVEMLPGLLFLSAVISQEPVYEAQGRVSDLQNNIMVVVLLNASLNCFLVPFAGLFGAAFATSCSMFVYFILFGRHLNPMYQLNKRRLGIAGAAVYLTYMVCKTLDLPFPITVFMVVTMLFVLFYAINMFNFQSEQKGDCNHPVLFENNL